MHTWNFIIIFISLCSFSHFHLDRQPPFHLTLARWIGNFMQKTHWIDKSHKEKPSTYFFSSTHFIFSYSLDVWNSTKKKKLFRKKTLNLMSDKNDAKPYERKKNNDNASKLFHIFFLPTSIPKVETVFSSTVMYNPADVLKLTLYWGKLLLNRLKCKSFNIFIKDFIHIVVVVVVVAIVMYPIYSRSAVRSGFASKTRSLWAHFMRVKNVFIKLLVMVKFWFICLKWLHLTMPHSMYAALFFL